MLHQEAEERAEAARARKLQAKNKSKSRHSVDTPPPAKRRRSTRIMSTKSSITKENLNSDPIDFLSHPASSPLKKRTPIRLRPRPSNPERRPVYVESSAEDDDDTEGRDENYSDEESNEVEHREPLPTRDENGTLYFADEPSFAPNMTPEEMLREGSYGGTTFSCVIYYQTS